VLQPRHVKWPWLRQWCRLTRTRTDKKTGKTTVEVVYFITSLPPSMASPAMLLKLIRDHWSIENLLHRNRDMLLKEDASTVRKNNAPQALAACRNTTLQRLTQQHTSPTIAIERNAANPTNAFKQLLM
jgi:predicted transposase YbfD/YdcC